MANALLCCDPKRLSKNLFQFQRSSWTLALPQRERKAGPAGTAGSASAVHRPPMPRNLVSSIRNGLPADLEVDHVPRDDRHATALPRWNFKDVTSVERLPAESPCLTVKFRPFPRDSPKSRGGPTILFTIERNADRSLAAIAIHKPHSKKPRTLGGFAAFCCVVPLARLERARLSTNDFESFASTIPPQGHAHVLPMIPRRLSGDNRHRRGWL